ncbi:MAG: hypothetical protein D6712_09310, partial [Chloroflexi bacterium]
SGYCCQTETGWMGQSLFNSDFLFLMNPYAIALSAVKLPLDIKNKRPCWALGGLIEIPKMLDRL